MLAVPAPNPAGPGQPLNHTRFEMKMLQFGPSIFRGSSHYSSSAGLARVSRNLAVGGKSSVFLTI